MWFNIWNICVLRNHILHVVIYLIRPYLFFLVPLVVIKSREASTNPALFKTALIRSQQRHQTSAYITNIKEALLEKCKIHCQSLFLLLHDHLVCLDQFIVEVKNRFNALQNDETPTETKDSRSFGKKNVKYIVSPFLSPPVPMHGGLICLALRLSVTRPKVLEKNSYLWNGLTYGPQIWSQHGRGWPLGWPWRSRS